MKLLRGDIFLVAICLIALVAWLLWPAGESGLTAQVKVGSEIVMTIDLDQNGLYPVQGIPGAGILEVKDGQIRMQEMSRDICPNGICCRLTGWIEKTTQSIVCLPNKIVVSLIGLAETDVDLISG